MKLNEHFKIFMEDVVDINATRLQLLDDSAGALKRFIRESEWQPRVRSFLPQGSWAHKTIIKPLRAGPFDADLLVLIDEVPGWNAKEYISSLRAIFAASDLYREKVHRYSHCVTIEYAGERKVDIAPCIVDRDGWTRLEVCNFQTGEFERSEPIEYTDWLIERNKWTGANGLRKVTRLLKYLRDVKTTFTCPSILLTTLLGERILALDEYNSSEFEDLPTSLRTIVGRLDDWLQARPIRPTITNPKLSTEILSDLWDDTQYENFRSFMNKYRAWIDEAYAELDRDESIGLWQRVFGEEFAKSAIEERAALSKSLIAEDAVLSSTALARPGVFDDLVTRYLRLGRRAIPQRFNTLPYLKRPVWRRIPNAALEIHVEAREYTTRTGGVWLRNIESGTVVPKHHSLKFDVRTATGLPLPNDFEIHWRVANTDDEAIRAQALRGDFYRSNDGASRWEDLAFRGIHRIEAFIVRKRDNGLVGQTEPFLVVIE